MGGGEIGLIEVGRITRAHGLRGEVKVISYSDQPERFQFLRSVYLSSHNYPGEWKKILKYHPGSGLKHAILQLEKVDTREDAEQVCGCTLSVNRDDLPDLPGGFYYISDIIGYDVVTSESGKIGILKDVLKMPAQDVYVIETEKGEVMIPAVEEFLKGIHPSRREIQIRPIDGLLDLNAD